jgi:hypothetical protein
MLQSGGNVLDKLAPEACCWPLIAPHAWKGQGSRIALMLVARSTGEDAPAAEDAIALIATGRQLRALLESGGDVPDELALEVVLLAIARTPATAPRTAPMTPATPAAAKAKAGQGAAAAPATLAGAGGFVLDGFPATAAQVCHMLMHCLQRADAACVWMPHPVRPGRFCDVRPAYVHCCRRSLPHVAAALLCACSCNVALALGTAFLSVLCQLGLPPPGARPDASGLLSLTKGNETNRAA